MNSFLLGRVIGFMVFINIDVDTRSLANHKREQGVTFSAGENMSIIGKDDGTRVTDIDQIDLLRSN